jgi:hypothetical protein
VVSKYFNNSRNCNIRQILNAIDTIREAELKRGMAPPEMKKTSSTTQNANKKGKEKHKRIRNNNLTNRFLDKKCHRINILDINFQLKGVKCYHVLLFAPLLNEITRLYFLELSLKENYV